MTDIPALSATQCPRNVAGGSSLVTIPVTISGTAAGITLQTANASFTITQSLNGVQLQALLKHPLLLRLPQQALVSATDLNAVLFRVGQSSTFPLPPALAALIPKTGDDRHKLLAQARGSQGYLLGLAKVEAGKLKFDSGQVFPAPKGAASGIVRARLGLRGGELSLLLDAIDEELPVTLSRITQKGNSLGAISSQISEVQARFRTTPQALLVSMEKKLLATSAAGQTARETSRQQPGAEAITSTIGRSREAGTYTATNRLSSALEKTGALLPQTDANPTTPEHSNFEPARRLLALLKPLPVNALMGADAMRSAIESAASSSLLPKPLSIAELFQSQPLALVFQLLLGGMALKQEQPLTPLLQAWISLLAKKAGLSSQDLTQLASDELLDDVSKLATSRRELVTASNERAGWYFALPYLLGDRQQTLEGHFQRHNRRNADDSSACLWQLKLKFSLTEGELMVKANRRQSDLSVTFISPAPQLTRRISNFVPILSEHLQALGFAIGQVHCQQGKVPPSLLPDEQFSFDLRV